jgi:hypothetical protein
MRPCSHQPEPCALEEQENAVPPCPQPCPGAFFLPGMPDTEGVNLAGKAGHMVK